MACFARCWSCRIGECPWTCVSRLSPKGMLAFRACFSTQYERPFPLACFKHAALTGINGSLAEINVESPACGARSNTTIVRKLQWGQVVFYHYSFGRAISPVLRAKPEGMRSSHGHQTLALSPHQKITAPSVRPTLRRSNSLNSWPEAVRHVEREKRIR